MCLLVKDKRKTTYTARHSLLFCGSGIKEKQHIFFKNRTEFEWTHLTIDTHTTKIHH